VGNELSDKQREDIWCALSDVFVDTEVDYEGVAKRVADIDPDQLKEIFFTEVAPYCGSNLLVPIPPIWAGFARESLVNGILEELKLNRHSLSARVRFAFYRWQFREDWERVAAELAKLAGAQKNPSASV